MKIRNCYHIRIRDTSDYGLDVDNFIKSLEKQYDFDLRKLPQWKELVQRLHVTTTDCKRRIQDANLRKKIIIDNLYLQNTRLSPFELTDMLARTAKTWKTLEIKRRKHRVSIKPAPEVISTGEEIEEMSGEISEIQFTAHPNTEIIPSQNIIEPPLKSDIDTEVNPDEISHLPIHISINQHKIISPLGTQDSGFSYKSQLDYEVTLESELKEWLSLKQTSLVKCFPKEITITNNNTAKQSISFSIVNCTTEYLNIRFKCVTDKSRLKKSKILPETPKRLYPGIAVPFKLKFKFPTQNENDFTSSLYFRVGRNVLAESPTEAFLIPIVSKFIVESSVSVSETVHFPSAYSWHINEKCGFPSGIVKVSINNDKNYHVHILKRLVNLITESDSSTSVEATGPNTESIIRRKDPTEIEIQSRLFTPSKADVPLAVAEVESLKTIDYIDLILDELVTLALETFVFEHTYLDLAPHSKRYIAVYFTKAEHIGYHQCYYDFEFCDPETENVILTKTVLLLAEVLPHPVRYHPEILDMSNSPITHGFCEDYITITNTHKLYLVNVKIKLTSKMVKLFHVTPMETVIPPQSKVNFDVRICSREFKFVNKPEDFAHFTFKIIFRGIKSIYHNVPPLFYEIIAPCAFEFKKVYNEKFYREVSDRSLQMNGTQVCVNKS